MKRMLWLQPIVLVDYTINIWREMFHVQVGKS